MYNGWKNHATWNANLWLNNEEVTYNALCGIENVESLKEFYLATFGEYYDDINVEEVDFKEIFDNIKDTV